MDSCAHVIMSRMCRLDRHEITRAQLDEFQVSHAADTQTVRDANMLR